MGFKLGSINNKALLLILPNLKPINTSPQSNS